MENLRTNIDQWLIQIDARWRALPLKKQYKYILYCFISYLILTVVVTLSVWFETGKNSSKLDEDRIENALIKKNESTTSLGDSLLLIIKNRRHERK
ncbi:nitrogen regulatory IIA protein [Flavobacterium sp. P4023]|uniref:Nitrogen regulatory IIA protein n=1 Tax=Flavobacterium flabelliforme TaxID=2816119 RepID=A0ABS5CTZ8_9FLAO|nr:nitrogen regulatory IIA protein [Flavobacterium flabelliforme]MBP4142084.1 nitrogen regulatory IIA protein [Flavobacterium flabelliforme]